MIPIKRPPAPVFLTDPKGLWQAETAQAIEHYKDGKKKKAFDFGMFNDFRLKEALKAVFKKCAYCETDYGPGYDGDVEHFRPKGKVKEKKPQTPGYYWLANDWDNLLLSCQHCNQNRRHLLEGEAERRAIGKLDQFPLEDESKRAVAHTSVLNTEEPARLLLNPCKDNPDEHFEYNPREGVIIPLTPKGEASVRVYALQRPLLVRGRKKQLMRLFEQMESVERELKKLNEAPSVEQREAFDHELDKLIGYTGPEENYAGMCRFFVRKFLKETGVRP